MPIPGMLQIGIQLGLDAILVKPKREIGGFVAHVTISEEHFDEMYITQQPVEQGAAVSDHAFKLPARLVVEAGWSNTPNSNSVGSSSSLLGSLAGAVTGTIGGVLDLAAQAGSPFNGINSAVSQLGDVVTSPLTLAGEFANNALTSVTDAASSVAQGAQSLASQAVGAASEVVSNVSGGIEGALGAGADVLGGLGGDLSDAVGGVSEDFSGGLEGLSSSTSGDNVGQVKDVYARFLALQESASPFDVFTGKRVYKDMLIKSMSTRTDNKTENALLLRIEMHQIIIVAQAVESSVTSDASEQEDPQETDPTSDEGDVQLDDAPTYNEDAGTFGIDISPPFTLASAVSSVTSAAQSAISGAVSSASSLIPSGFAQDQVTGMVRSLSGVTSFPLSAAFGAISSNGPP